jgi:hypothetical protein
MALSKIGLLAVKGTRGLSKKIQDKTGFSRQAINNWVNSNHENLTRAAILDIIISETGLSKDQILEQETTETA